MENKSLPPEDKDATSIVEVQRRENTELLQGGAFIRPVTTVRAMKCYSLNENEMQSITLLNTATSLFGSLFLTFILLAIGLRIDAILEGILTEEAKLLAQYGFWGFLFLSLTFAIIAIIAWVCRRSILQRIIRETEVKD